ncbi:MAG: DUF4386 domain-containing protein [Reichenbachiella sp.]
MNSQKSIARLAGLSFLLLIITGVFAQFAVRNKLINWEDAAATITNITEHPILFRLGFISDEVMGLTYLFFGLIMYRLLKPINKNQAVLMVTSIIIAVAMISLGVVSQLAVILILKPGNLFASAFSPEQINALCMFFLDLQRHNYMSSQIYYGLYMLPLGYLIYQSGFLPKIIGVFLILGFAGDMIDFLRFFLIPNYSSVILDNITIPADIGEISLCLYLLIKGTKTVLPNTVIDPINSKQLSSITS